VSDYDSTVKLVSVAEFLGMICTINKV